MKLIPVGSKYFAKVDDEDFDKIKKYKWTSLKIGGLVYARNTPGRFLMHRFIMGTPRHLVVDHINRDGLDNRKKNLRNCTQGKNLRNAIARQSSGKTSQYKGVHYSNQPRLKNHWIAQIEKEYSVQHIGCFVDEISAARAYDKLAKLYFGDYAFLNFP